MMVVAPETVLGLPRRETDELLSALGCAHGDHEETLSAIIWSHLTEPGDLLSGQLISILGAKNALSALRSRDSISRYLEALGLDSKDQSGEVHSARNELAEACQRWKTRDNNAAVLRSLNAWRRLGGEIVTPGSDDWPRSLDALGFGAPHVLWLRGNRSALRALDRAVSLVGSRNVSSYGVHCAQALAERLVTEDYAVVSGGAYGVDAEAHRGALSAGGITIAVLAGGADRFYPIGNSQLLQDVMREGCVLAELPPGNAPTRWRFLQRNRLIAALGKATVVVEMALRSGAKNTMNHALAISRDVYAVPGSLLNSTARGCNIAIAENKAKIVTGFDEFIKDLNDEPYSFESSQYLSPLQQRVLDALHGSGITSERVAFKAGTTTSETLQALAELEAMALAQRGASGWRQLLGATE